MKAFADLLTALLFAPGRNAKLRLMARYFEAAPDPDRGWALAALAGELSLGGAKPALFRALVEERVDPALFRYSYDYVGDLAETVSLIWPGAAGEAESPPLGEVVEQLSVLSRAAAPGVLAALLDRLAPDGRFALVKLATGGLRVGVSARMAKAALVDWSAMRGVSASLDRIEELWHGLEPPYAPLFSWLSGDGPEPRIDLSAAFRPMMLAHPIDVGLYAPEELRSDATDAEETLSRMRARLDPSDYAAEWKWDGIRVQAIARGGARRLFSRTGDDIAAAFPEIVEALDFDGALDGELLILRDGVVAPFADLQKRLGRKRVGPKLLRESPAHLRVYDILRDGDRDLRPEPFRTRRAALETFVGRLDAERVDLSEPIAFDDWDALAARRAAATAEKEGVMLKRWDGAYQGGRPVGQWWKWKRDPMTADCVLLYAQRGHGKRSSFFSDYTFGAWREGGDGLELTPVGKAYSGFTDAELGRLDAWVRANTLERYGPVRALRPEMVVEVAFDAVQRSTRHKSGVALRFPRIKRVRWEKPAAEADHLETLQRMIRSPAADKNEDDG